jgi:hypothetical protein
MYSLFTVAGALAVLTGVALYQGFDAYRWRDGRRLTIALLASLPLGAAACLALWFGAQHPGANFWGNWGLGPDWECSNQPASARVCARDLPARYQDAPMRATPPAAAPNSN